MVLRAGYGVGQRPTQACMMGLHGACKGRRCSCECGHPLKEASKEW